MIALQQVAYHRNSGDTSDLVIVGPAWLEDTLLAPARGPDYENRFLIANTWQRRAMPPSSCGSSASRGDRAER